MLYTDNKALKKAIKALVRANGSTLAEVANNYGITPQALQDKLNKVHIGFDDVAIIADMVGYQLEYDFTPKDTATDPQPEP